MPEADGSWTAATSSPTSSRSSGRSCSGASRGKGTGSISPRRRLPGIHGGATVVCGMAFTFSILVVANRTADSDELLAALKAHTESHPTTFTLLVPAPAAGPAGREAGKGALERALAPMRDTELEVEGQVGHHDPIAAFHD